MKKKTLVKRIVLITLTALLELLLATVVWQGVTEGNITDTRIIYEKSLTRTYRVRGDKFAVWSIPKRAGCRVAMPDRL